MNPGRRVLEKLAIGFQKHARGSEDYVFRCRHEGFNFKIKVKDTDKYSLCLTGLELKTSPASKHGLDELTKWARAIVERVSYLRENLQILEEDTRSTRVQLRSATPKEADSTIAFYEMILAGRGTINLVRCEFDRTQRTKNTVPFDLTKAVFEELIRDLTVILKT